jgi:hypothetical protein
LVDAHPWRRAGSQKYLAAVLLQLFSSMSDVYNLV